MSGPPGCRQDPAGSARAAATAAAGSSARRMPWLALSETALTTQGTPPAPLPGAAASSGARGRHDPERRLGDAGVRPPPPLPGLVGGGDHRLHRVVRLAPSVPPRPRPGPASGCPRRLPRRRARPRAASRPALRIRVARVDVHDREAAQRQRAVAADDQVQAHAGSPRRGSRRRGRYGRAPAAAPASRPSGGLTSLPSLIAGSTAVTVSRGEERLGPGLVVGDVDSGRSCRAAAPAAAARCPAGRSPPPGCSPGSRLRDGCGPSPGPRWPAMTRPRWAAITGLISASRTRRARSARLPQRRRQRPGTGAGYPHAR